MTTFKDISLEVVIIVRIVVRISISGWVLTCDSTHSLGVYSAFPLGNQGSGNMTWYPTQSHYCKTELTSPCHVFLILSARLAKDKHRVDKSLVWVDKELNP